MKKNSSSVRGPKVRYFNHRVGTVTVRKPIMRSFVLPVFMTVGMMGGMFYGFGQYQDARTAVVRANETKPQVIETVDKKESLNDQKPRQAKEDKKLANAIEKKLDSMPKNTKWAVSVRDLKSDRMANIRADQMVDSGSLYTMFLLSALEKKQPADKWKYKMNVQTVQDCVMKMINVSDAECSEAIGRNAGWQNINPQNRGLGFNNTSISSATEQKTTARDVSELMYRLQNSQMLSDKARRIVFDALYSQQSREGVPKGCGISCLVANKTSEFNDVKHDSAIVTHGSSQYVVVIMSSGTTWAQVADVAKSIHEEMRP